MGVIGLRGLGLGAQGQSWGPSWGAGLSGLGLRDFVFKDPPALVSTKTVDAGSPTPPCMLLDSTR